MITVDGPAAAGKSTAARRLARKLGFRYLDTGAMYRAATWKALREGVETADAERLREVVARTALELRPDGRVLCDGMDVTRQIRTPEVTENIFRLADRPGVRKVMRKKQRQFAEHHDVVAEGRDQGTEVFPDADLKFYLTASLEERVRRRTMDLRAAGENASEEDVRAQLARRDAKDRARPVGALRRTEEMILIDNTDLTADEVLRRMLAHVRRRTPM